MTNVRMLTRWAAAGALGFLLTGLSTTVTQAAEPTGVWKLVLLAIGDDEVAIIDLHRQDGRPRGVLVAGRQGMLDKAKVVDAQLEEDQAGFTLEGGAVPIVFHGTLAKEGPHAGQILGSVRLQNATYAARMEKTIEDRVGLPRPGALNKEYFDARNEKDPKKQVTLFRNLIEKHKRAPVCFAFYEGILKAAGRAGLTTVEVDALLADWQLDAAPYGPTWRAEVGMKALTALAGQKDFAATSLRLAKDVDRLLPENGPAEPRVETLNRLIAAARLVGDEAIAIDAQGRIARLETQLDEEYLARPPAFQVKPYEGRKEAEADRVVLMELFTGAQCPPCVAVDVAFDGLLKTYKPTEFIGLQYHLHIPGPDPLANADAYARADYYGDQVGGTPATFFNGKADGGGGGPLGAAEAKYNEFRTLIDRRLELKTTAEVTVSARRQGDEITIDASAVFPRAKSIEPGAEVPKTSSTKLRLALTEESIRYVGGNRLRFHHHVVRSLPGGPEGVDVIGGRARTEVKVNLADLRKQLETELAEAAERRPFPGQRPEIELKDLHVVAFVQDDLDRIVLGAASAAVTSANP